MTRKEFKFAAKHNLPFFFVSAADGTNIVKVQACDFSAFVVDITCSLRQPGTQVFQSAILEAKKYKASGGDALADVLDLLSSGPGDAQAKASDDGKVR